MKTKLFLIFFLIAVSEQLSGQDFDSLLALKLQQTLDYMRTSTNCVKGISVGVYVPGEGTWLGVSGVSHQNVNITRGMRFGIGSHTKLFTSVLMLKLAEMNALSLDDRIDKWLPDFEYIDPSITIRQLLNHTSGVFNIAEHKTLWGKMHSHPEKIWTREEVLVTFMNPPYFSPGQGWHYSNTNYVLAGMIIKAATGSSFSTNLRQLILNPLGLNETYFSVEDPVEDTVSHRWWNCSDQSHLSFNSWCSAFSTAGAIFSTAENSVRWYREIFEGQILNQSSLDQLFTFITTGDNSIPQYGLGIVRLVLGSRVQFGHAGSFIYRSLTLLDSTSGVIVMALVNGTDDNHNAGFVFNLTFALQETVFDNLGDNPSAIVNNNKFFNESFPLFENSASPIETFNSDESMPDNFRLCQNYPNPFNPVTKIKFAFPLDVRRETQDVRIVVYDAIGKEVTTLINEKLSGGSYEVEFDGSKLTSGIYFYSLSIDGNIVDRKKMFLLK